MIFGVAAVWTAYRRVDALAEAGKAALLKTAASETTETPAAASLAG